MNAISSQRARDALQRCGHVISVRRMSSGNPQTTISRADVKAIVTGYTVQQLVAGITSGRRSVIVSRVDLDAAGYPLPVRKGDRIYLGAGLDVVTTIESVDIDHREYTGCLDITTNGA